MLALRQSRYENKAFWRNPASAFFTFAFPLLFLVIFTTLLGGSESTTPGGLEVSTATYYVGSILAFGVITACYTNVAILVTFARDEGVLKRVRGTPMPAWAYLLGKVLHAIFIQFVLVIIVLIFGKITYDIDFPTDTWLPFVTTLAVGSAAFCSLGLAITSVIPNAEASPAIVNITVLPLLFLSGVFIPTDQAPAWVSTIAGIFPIKHFLDACLVSFLGPGSGWRGGDLLILGIWAIGGLIAAARFFSWEPRR